ncbi:hypothetical protein E2C01_052968 [Portunus trituberculatus]|uniref:Uncharacterized protein n=1 Tax=Portunus trituberculatus TaxID=210409 RepID=A0A5B7GQS1_PORTR|nr:hypothetical protein [Portunus trituberculatus]
MTADVVAPYFNRPPNCQAQRDGGNGRGRAAAPRNSQRPVAGAAPQHIKLTVMLIAEGDASPRAMDRRALRNTVLVCVFKSVQFLREHGAVECPKCYKPCKLREKTCGCTGTYYIPKTKKKKGNLWQYPVSLVFAAHDERLVNINYYSWITIKLD